MSAVAGFTVRSSTSIFTHASLSVHLKSGDIGILDLLHDLLSLDVSNDINPLQNQCTDSNAINPLHNQCTDTHRHWIGCFLCSDDLSHIGYHMPWEENRDNAYHNSNEYNIMSLHSHTGTSSILVIGTHYSRVGFVELSTLSIHVTPTRRLLFWSTSYKLLKVLDRIVKDYVTTNIPT